MKRQFNHDYMRSNCGCYEQDKLMLCSFMQSETVTIESIVNSEIPLKDKYWFVIKKCELTIYQKRQISIDVAEMVLPIYESKYPNDFRVRECVEATKKFLAGHISVEKLIEKRKAADAAAAAADAAAAYAAAAAAAADDAAAADAAAAAADAAAAYAAAAAADAAAAYAAAADAAAAAADAAAAYAAAAAADAAAAYAAAAAADAAAAYAIKQQLHDYLVNFINNN